MNYEGVKNVGRICLITTSVAFRQFPVQLCDRVTDFLRIALVDNGG